MQVAIQYDSKSLEMRNALQESALLRRVRAHGSGCQTLCSVLLEPHRSAIYRRCLFRLGNVHDAEDAAQETMLRALQGIQGFEGRSGLRTWLCAIADNECSSLVQRRKRHQYSDHVRCLIRIHEEQQKTSPTVDQDKAQLVRETLMRLPPRAREVLGLRFFGEASLDEIARTLGISLSAAKMRLYRALALFEANYPEAQRIAERTAGSLEVTA